MTFDQIVAEERSILDQLSNSAMRIYLGRSLSTSAKVEHRGPLKGSIGTRSLSTLFGDSCENFPDRA